VSIEQIDIAPRQRRADSPKIELLLTDREYKAKFWSQEPITQQDYYVQEKQDRQLIAKISAGEPVSQDEVEQALR
jgi:hypothetical protein